MRAAALHREEIDTTTKQRGASIIEAAVIFIPFLAIFFRNL